MSAPANPSTPPATPPVAPPATPPATPSATGYDPVSGLVTALLYVAAADLTRAAVSTEPTLAAWTQPSQDESDPNLRAMNIQVGEIFKTMERFVISRYNLAMAGDVANVGIANIQGLVQQAMAGLGPQLPALLATLGPLLAGGGVAGAALGGLAGKLNPGGP